MVSAACAASLCVVADARGAAAGSIPVLNPAYGSVPVAENRRAAVNNGYGNVPTAPGDGKYGSLPSSSPAAGYGSIPNNN